MIISSEHQFQRHLYISRLTGRENSAHRGGLNISNRISESRRIGEIEELGAELEVESLAQAEVAHGEKLAMHCADVRGGKLQILNWQRLSHHGGFDPTYLYADLAVET